jgi:hypothetical protein
LTCKQKWIINLDLGRWNLEEVGLENAVNGITNNAAKSMNNIYRNLRSKVKPKPTAALMVELKALDDRIEMETTRAYHGLGTFSLTKDKKNLAKPPEELRSSYKKSPAETLAEMAEIAKADEKERKEWEEAARDLLAEPASDHPVSVLAKQIVENDKITDWSLGGERYYAVQGLDKKNYHVCFNTKNPSCSCGARSVCKHMIATPKAVGLQSDFGIPPEFKKYLPGDRVIML